MPELREGLLLGKVYFGNGYSALSTVNQFVYQPITKDFLHQLFHQNVTSVEAHIPLVFATRYFSAEFSPYRVQYVSEIHNPNLPVIAIHASVEKSLSFSGGIPLSWVDSRFENFSFGSKLRLIQRDYVHGSFSFFDVDAIGSDPRTLLPSQTQYGVLVDSSVGWAPPKMFWKPRVSVSLKNMGKLWPEDPLYPKLTDINLGVGVEPPLGFGRFRMGVDLINLVQAEALLARVRLGASYQFGILEVMAGLNQNSLATGLQFALHIFQAGIVYEFVRDDFGGADPESRVATELAVRL
ncbi:hypothetical protein WDW37_01785 [Bdellovibrionota bacterium FG-1]